ncbi:peptidoglycan-binding domain-containing protein, partial [Streptomyces sp. SAI-25]|uniref:peptidoglycan-binding domain-containing protein n=1 Tax=Streptomyces sp. SAI-25 TaxID=1472664 RepID=UPI00403A382D
SCSATVCRGVIVMTLTSITGDPPPVLTLGSTGPEVADLQSRLEQLHLYHGAYDGAYDQDLAEAVHRFQWIRRIDEPAGVYGPATRAALLAETGPARRRA